MIFIVTCIKKKQYIFYLINNKILKMSTFILLLSTYIVFYIKLILQKKKLSEYLNLKNLHKTFDYWPWICKLIWILANYHLKIIAKYGPVMWTLWIREVN